MATPIRMPDLGTTVESVRLIEWLKEEGDPVERGEPLCEVETDKAVSELESAAEGVLLKRLVEADSEIDAGTIIAYVGAAGESVPDSEAEAPTSGATEEPARPEVGRGTGRTRIDVSPVVRKLAEREGVDLTSVAGTGPGGTVTREDVRRAASSSPSAKAAPAAGRAGARPLNRAQLAVARRVVRSLREIPTIHLSFDLEMNAAMSLRRRARDEGGATISVDAIMLYALSRTIKRFKGFMGRVHGEDFVPGTEVNLGLAIGLEDKLCTPVIRRVDTLSLPAIQREIERLRRDAETDRLGPETMAGGLLTFSNLGMYPVRSFQMIIPPDQTAALSIGAIEDRPVIRDGTVEATSLCTAVLSVDHRSVNGREAACFIQHFKEGLEAIPAEAITE